MQVRRPTWLGDHTHVVDLQLGRFLWIYLHPVKACQPTLLLHYSTTILALSTYNFRYFYGFIFINGKSIDLHDSATILALSTYNLRDFCGFIFIRRKYANLHDSTIIHDSPVLPNYYIKDLWKFVFTEDKTDIRDTQQFQFH